MPPDAPATPATIEGTVSRVVWTSPDGRFAVVRVEVEGREAPVTVVGPLIGMGPGELLSLEGTWEVHPTFGQQLRVERAVPVVPRSGEGVERYLAGLKGIGPKLAKRLVGRFGTKAIEVLAD